MVQISENFLSTHQPKRKVNLPTDVFGNTFGDGAAIVREVEVDF
jgi:hypothetical protein